MVNGTGPGRQYLVFSTAREAALGAFPDKVYRRGINGRPPKISKSKKTDPKTDPKKEPVLDQFWSPFWPQNGPQNEPKIGPKIVNFGVHFWIPFF